MNNIRFIWIFFELLILVGIKYMICELYIISILKIYFKKIINIIKEVLLWFIYVNLIE